MKKEIHSNFSVSTSDVSGAIPPMQIHTCDKLTLLLWPTGLRDRQDMATLWKVNLTM